MKNDYKPLGWFLIAALGVALLVWAYPRATPTFPLNWDVDRDEVVEIALASLEDLGEGVEDPEIQVRLDPDEILDNRLAQLGEGGEVDLGESRMGQNSLVWEVTVLPRGEMVTRWTYRVGISPEGQVLRILKNIPADEARGELTSEEARIRADAFLEAQGYDLSKLDEPEERLRQLQNRTDRTLRYRDPVAKFGPDVPYGIAVRFAGDELSGIAQWMEDPDDDGYLESLQGFILVQFAWLFSTLPLLLIVAIPFVRRYHAGEIGVRRATVIFVTLMVCGVVFLILAARVLTRVWGVGPVTVPQAMGMVGLQLGGFYFFPMALVAALSWSVGEVLARQQSPFRLAGFDALFRGAFSNATVARDSLRGIASGVLLSGAIMALGYLIHQQGAVLPIAFQTGTGWWQPTRWFGLSLVALTLPSLMFHELFGRLLLVSAFSKRLGQWVGGGLAAVISGLLTWPPLMILPLPWAVGLSILLAAVLTFLFLRYGLATTLFTSASFTFVTAVYPYLLSEDRWVQFQATLPLLILSIPLIVSIRHLVSGEKFFYRWDDVPPHVRRIAERERQRVELETARRIQSSILPDLPPRLAGVDIAHAYRPASEVGGDFYDVLALEDGRLALAIGDVAGHGVSSGLVMSMAKSALAVQVTFNPEVEEVFSTLNRVIYQSARKRLLATLCYAVLDPVSRELLYASAGHLYPYVITQAGQAHPLEYVAYPLGVRGSMDVDARKAKLGSGDTLFLLSDGLIEAHPEGSDEMYGFERLEACLLEHRGEGVDRLRDAVLDDIERFTGGAPQEDDQTVLVLRVP